MKAFILAAGKGERLRPLTLTTPKPLLCVQGKPLLQWHLESLRSAGISDVVINVSWLREQIIDFVQQAEFADMKIQISDEGDRPLETGGGILKALPLLNDDPFLVINADVFTSIDFNHIDKLSKHDLVHLVLVDNPAHNPTGDFSVINGRLDNEPQLTYSGIGLFSPQLFKGITNTQPFSVVPLIREAISNNCASAVYYNGIWNDVGTEARLQQLNS